MIERRADLGEGQAAGSRKKPNSPFSAIRTTRSVEAMPWYIEPATYACRVR
ncbi:hypothetical protein SHIRM173S_10201 [Streptomyces hirsutus]